MPTYTGSRHGPPKSWEEFEDIVCSAAKNRWRNPDFVRHGRQGQEQYGVDVYGKDDKGRIVGLQCKNTWSSLSKKKIEKEVGKAEAFKPTLSKLYIVTAADTDQNLQAFARDISDQRAREQRFEVDVLFWPDIWQDLCLEENRLFQHYPHLKPRANDRHDVQLFEEFQKTFGFEPAVRLLRDQNFGDSFARKAVQPLYDFVETWNQPEKEFIDEELQAALTQLYKAADGLATHLVEKTVPVGSGKLLSVFSDNLRAMGPRPDWVKEEARVLNAEAAKFVPIYEQFVRLCRKKLSR
jgi:hypothetical protein